MSNPIKYSTTTEPLSLKSGNFHIGTGDVDKGPTNISGYYNGITPPTGGYTIYINKPSGGPTIYVCNSDSELIKITNTMFNQTFNTVEQCFVYYNTQNDKMVLNGDYEKIVTNGLVLNLDAGYLPSYPKSGTTWTDLSGNGNNGTLVNGVGYNGDNKGSLIFDGSNEYLRIPPSSKLLNYFETNNFTIQTIVRSDNVIYPRSRHPIYVNGTVTTVSSPGWSAGHQSTNSSIQIISGDGVNRQVTNINHDVIESTIYHRIFTIDRTNGLLTKYYVDGRYIGQADHNLVTGSIYDGTTTDFQTGFVFGYVWGWRYIGSIFNISIYNRALTAQEVLQNFNATKGRYGL